MTDKLKSFHNYKIKFKKNTVQINNQELMKDANASINKKQQ